MSLYNCKASGSSYRLTKFSNDLEVEASYLTDGRECDCPAGHRPVCRHRIMLPRFIAKNATAGQWFHNYEHQQWVRAAADDEPDILGDFASAASQVSNTAWIDEASNVTTEMWNETIKPINLLALAEPPIESGGCGSVGRSSNLVITWTNEDLKKPTEPYGIGPAITNDLPVIREYNEAKREQLVKAEQLRIEAKPLRRL